MDELEQKYLDSREVAEMVGKDHNMMLRNIRRYEEQLGQSKIAQSDFFTKSTYRNSQNKIMPCYLVTKKDFEFIAHKLTGVKGTEFTAKYINYTPKNPAEGLFELVGRIKAFAAYVNSTKYSIEREICASMLGFELEEETKDAREDSNIKMDC